MVHNFLQLSLDSITSIAKKNILSFEIYPTKTTRNDAIAFAYQFEDCVEIFLHYISGAFDLFSLLNAINVMQQLLRSTAT